MEIISMKFVTIEAHGEKVKLVDVKHEHDALKLIGIDPMQTDHGMVFRDHESGIGVGIIVYEFGLFEPADETHYFILPVRETGNRLYAEKAVIYAFDIAGDSIDIPVDTTPPVTFYHSRAVVEEAIKVGIVARPEASVNGEVTWRWPDPPPAKFHKKMRENGRPPR
jgi:hypothetical protein